MTPNYHRSPLAEAQAHARANNIEQYWRIHYTGRVHVLQPRAAFAFTQEECERLVLIELRNKRTVQAEALRTEEVSDSPHAR